MLQHYIKTAFRHLLKYKTQNLISILGLSVGIYALVSASIAAGSSTLSTNASPIKNALPM